MLGKDIATDVSVLVEYNFSVIIIICYILCVNIDIETDEDDLMNWSELVGPIVDDEMRF